MKEIKKSLDFMSDELSKMVKKTRLNVSDWWSATTKTAKIARQARILKKEKQIQDTWTRNCKVMINFMEPQSKEK